MPGSRAPLEEVATPPPAAFRGHVTVVDQPQMRHLELLLRVAKEVAAHDTLEEMLRNIVTVSAEETGAERGTLFLNDERTGELYSRFAQGTTLREIRILNNVGVAGHVFTTGVGALIAARSLQRSTLQLQSRSGNRLCDEEHPLRPGQDGQG